MRERFAGFGENGWLARPFVEHPVVPVPESYEELKETSGSEGETWEHPDTGVVYYYSEVVSKWLRDEAYDLADATVELEASISGAVDPDEESPAFIDLATGGGTIASDGSEVTWNTVGQGVAVAYSTLVTGLSNSIHAAFAEGYIEIEAVEGSDSRLRCFLALTLDDNGKRIDLNFAYQDDKVRFVNNSNTPIGTAHADVDLVGNPRQFFQLLMDPDGTCYLWLDHAASPTLSVPFSSLGTSTGDAFSLGNADAGSGDNARLVASQIALFKLSETP